MKNENVEKKQKDKIKKPFYKRWWFWLIVAVVAGTMIGAFSEAEEGEPSQSNTTEASTAAQTQTDAAEKYEKVNLTKLFVELNENALRTKNNYQDKYVEFQAQIYEIDDDGNYIIVRGLAINDYNEAFCRIDKEHLDFIMQQDKYNVITVRGKISNIGDELGYKITVDVDYVGERIIEQN